MIVKRKLYSQIEEERRVFGEVKRANKAAMKAFAKNTKIVGGVVLGTTAVGTGAYLIKKHHDKMKNERKED